MMKLGIFGCGNMGSALILGAARNNPDLSPFCFDTDRMKAETLAAEANGKALPSAAAVAEESDAVLIAVKPQIISTVLEGLPLSGKLLISVAAGVTISTLTSAVPEARWIRVMPNTPALIGEGVLGWSAGPGVNEDDESFFTSLFSGSGSLYKFPEKLLDTVTGLSGSGPAYVFAIINALAEGAVLDGMPKTEALEIAAKTVLGSARMVIEEGVHPEVLKDRVTSPGGTTAAGLAVLEERGIRSALIDAVKRAADRSRELGAG